MHTTEKLPVRILNRLSAAADGVVGKVVAGILSVVVSAGLLWWEYAKVQPAYNPPAAAWATLHSIADVPGMDATGNIRVSNVDHLIHFDGHVRDTLADGQGARLKIFIDDQDGHESTLLFDDTHGTHSQQRTETGDLTFATTSKRIALLECLLGRSPTDNDTLVETRCGAAPFVIWENGVITIPH